MKTATLDRLHGIALIALMSLSAFYIAGIPEVKALSLSPLIVGIIIGMIYANTLRCRCAGIRCCLDSTHVTAYHDRHKTAAYMHLANQRYIRCLDHRIRRFNRADQASRLDHAQCF